MTISRLNLYAVLGALVLLTSLATVNFFMLDIQKEESKASGEFLLKTHNIANELRQSSEDLTRMARTYVLTGDKKYKDIYFRILDIRNGQSPRPLNYSATFWHTYKSRDLKVRLGNKIPLRKLMTEMGFLDEELALLDLAQSRSDKLVSLEVEAFAAMEGLFADESGDYTVKRVPDPKYASELLFGDQYHLEKSFIMMPIEEFISAVEMRVAANSDVLQSKHLAHLNTALFMIILGILVTLYIGYYVLRKVTHPLQQLRDDALEISKGHYGTRSKLELNNELGELSQSIDNMADAIESHVNELEELATTDPLTEIHNRRSAFSLLEAEIKRSSRYSLPLSLLMMDIDHFKSINDRFGHNAGDMVLRHVCSVCLKELREVDFMGRIGGEEFILVLPATEGNSANQVAERIRNSIEGNVILIGSEEMSVTASFGVVEGGGDETKEALLKRADEAMYLSKENGRNRVTRV